MGSDNRHQRGGLVIICRSLETMAHKRPEPDNAEARPTAKEVQVFVASRRRVPAGILLPLPAALEVMVACVPGKVRLRGGSIPAPARPKQRHY